jgi:uncharacterized membrane protein
LNRLELLQAAAAGMFVLQGFWPVLPFRALEMFAAWRGKTGVCAALGEG